MSYRSATDVDVASRALVMAGTKPINSFEDDTVEARTARLLYEDIAAAALTATTWRFTIYKQRLNRLDPNDDIGRGYETFQIPADCLQIRAVTTDDRPLPFERYENKVTMLHQIGEETVVIMEYTRRTPTEDWPPYFTVALQHILASEFAIAIGQNEQLSTLHAQKAQALMQSAKSIDAQGRTNSVIPTKRFIHTRRT